MVKEIFVLEDDRDIGFILNHILFDEGYQVSVYESISAFKYALRLGTPDLLLMDVRLPDGNGMELCEELKADSAFSLPVLMMSADWHLHNQGQCKANEYISKPFDIDLILNKIGSYLKPAVQG
ncbi:response regulator transcription factor [Pedobacter sp. GR22-6]|uniref:response regulator transcription factor n=1 Tax=Pedobacter sp. GR22-6 TaxID=3127957 RepID=UPI00307E9C95